MIKKKKVNSQFKIIKDLIFFWLNCDSIFISKTSKEFKKPLNIVLKIWINSIRKNKIKKIMSVDTTLLTQHIEGFFFLEKFNKIKIALKKYQYSVLFILLNISYLCLIALYDSFVYDKIINEWFKQYMEIKYEKK